MMHNDPQAREWTAAIGRELLSKRKALEVTGIYCGAALVGRVGFDASSGVRIAYAREWLEDEQSFPLSVTMPLSMAVYGNDAASPWLSNLLPEHRQLNALAQALGLSPEDSLAILKEIGGDTAGAVSIGQTSAESDWEFEPLSDRHKVKTESEALGLHIEELEHRPFLAGEDGVRTSLAGGQKKTALAVIDSDGRACLRLPGDHDRLAIPKSGAPSAVIIKPSNPRLPGIVENEAYCLTLAGRIGIPAAETGIIQAGDRKALAVLRYDRTAGDSGIRRIHQEDFAQANGLYPIRKYERGTVPGLDLKTLLATRRNLSANDALKLIDQVIFNILVANTDAHAKNYSMILGGERQLVPLYDVSTVLRWKDRGINQYHAQLLAGRKRKPRDLLGRHWDRIADESGLNRRGLRLRVGELVDAMVAERVAATETVAAQEGAAALVVEDIAHIVETNALEILKNLSEAG